MKSLFLKHPGAVGLCALAQSIPTHLTRIDLRFDLLHKFTDVGLAALAKHIAAQCPLLRFSGLMTIGEPGNLECFDTLAQCREAVAQELAEARRRLLLAAAGAAPPPGGAASLLAAPPRRPRPRTR